MIGFLIRPKVASLVFLRDKTDTENLGKILRIIIYLNRLLSKGQNLVIKKRKNTILKSKDNPAANLAIKHKSEDIFDIFKEEDPTKVVGTQTDPDCSAIFATMKERLIELVRRCNRNYIVNDIQSFLDIQAMSLYKIRGIYIDD
jgi:hypothetical protein